MEQESMIGNTDDTIDEVFRECLSALPSVEECQSPSLTTGAALCGVFSCESARRLQRPELNIQASRYIERAAELANHQSTTISLFEGLPSTAWSLRRVDSAIPVAGATNYLEDVHMLLIEQIKDLLDQAPIGLLDGVGGAIAYAVQCMNQGELTALMSNVEKWLIQSFEFWASEAAVYAGERETTRTDMGIAHGLPGLLGPLANACDRGAMSPDGVGLVRSGFDYLWRFAVHERTGGAYLPHFQHRVTRGRLAWCYGSLGAAFAYLQAGRLRNENIDRANDLINASLNQYEQEHLSITDASLCHGQSGVALMFSKIALSEDIYPSHRKRAGIYADQALTASLTLLGKEDLNKPEHSSNTGSASLLKGRMGIALALDAARRPLDSAIPKLLGLTNDLPHPSRNHG